MSIHLSLFDCGNSILTSQTQHIMKEGSGRNPSDVCCNLHRALEHSEVELKTVLDETVSIKVLK